MLRKQGSLAKAECNPITNQVVLTKQLGKFWQSMGYVQNGKLMLYPEEVIFLMDTSRLEVYQGKVPLSIQEAYAKFLNDDCPIEQYQTYAHLSRLGYIVVRHQGSFNITPYERQLGLHSHLYKTQARAQADHTPKLEKTSEGSVKASTSKSSVGSLQGNHASFFTVDDSPERKGAKQNRAPVLIVLDDEDSSDGVKKKSKSSNQILPAKPFVRTPPVSFPNMAGKSVLYLEIPHSSLLPPNVRLTDDMCTVDITKLHLPTNLRSTHKQPDRGSWRHRRGEWRGSWRHRNHHGDRRPHWMRNQEDTNKGSAARLHRDSSSYQGGHTSRYSGQECSPSRGRDDSPFRGTRGSPCHERDRSPHRKLDGSPHTRGYHSSDADEKIREPSWEVGLQSTGSQQISRNDDRWNSAVTTYHPYPCGSDGQRFPGLLNSRGCGNNLSDQTVSNLALSNIFHNISQNVPRWDGSPNINHATVFRPNCDSIALSGGANVLNNQTWSRFPQNPNPVQAAWEFPTTDRRNEVWEGFPETNDSVSNDNGQRRDNSSCNNGGQTYGTRNQRWDHSPNRKNFQVADRRKPTCNETAFASGNGSKGHNRQRWDNSPRNRHKDNRWRKESKSRQQLGDSERDRGVSSPLPQSSFEESVTRGQNQDTLDCSSWREYKQQLASHQDIEGLKSGPAGCLWNGTITPLIQPKDAISSARVLETLRTVKHLSVTSLSKSRFTESNPVLKVTYDVYLPNSGYVKTKPIFPNHRVIVTRVDDPFPNLADIGAPIATLEDGIPIHFAVVDNGNVSFFSFSDISLPLQSGVG